MFSKNRRKHLKNLVPITFLPVEKEEEEPEQDNRRPLTKREKKLRRFRKLRISSPPKKNPYLFSPLQSPLTARKPEVSLTATESNWFSKAVRALSPSTKHRVEERAVSPNPMQMPKLVREVSERSARFQSKDRLVRTAMRELKERLKQVGPEEDNDSDGSSLASDHVKSIFDVNKSDQIKRNALKFTRKSARADKRNKFIAAGGLDVVALNSDPPSKLLPDGYEVSPVVPNITPEVLVYRKIMYLWEGNPQAEGWFPGLICSTSRTAGCNFNIKYDRAQTKNLFVDGIQNVSLSLEGMNAYGRRWVILKKIDMGFDSIEEKII